MALHALAVWLFPDCNVFPTLESIWLLYTIQTEKQHSLQFGNKTIHQGEEKMDFSFVQITDHHLRETEATQIGRAHV